MPGACPVATGVKKNWDRRWYSAGSNGFVARLRYSSSLTSRVPGAAAAAAGVESGVLPPTTKLSLIAGLDAIIRLYGDMEGKAGTKSAV